MAAGTSGMWIKVVLLGVMAMVSTHAVAQDGGERVVVARVAGAEILQSDVDTALARIETMFPGAAPEGLDATTAVTPAGMERQLRLRAVALEQLIDELLLRGEIERAGIVVDKAEVEAAVSRLKQEVATRGTDWDTFLARSGRDEQSMRDQVSLEIGLQRLITPLIDDARLERSFGNRRRELDGTRLRVSHIVLRPDVGRGEEAIAEALARADEVRREVLADPSTFEAAARRYSAGPSRLRGGDLGWISRDAPCADDFARVAFTLAKGDISKPFATRFGIHLVRVTDVEPGRLGLEAVRAKIMPLVGREVLQEIVTRARSSAPVEYAAGTPHFERSDDGVRDGQSRRVVVEGTAPGGGGDAGG